MITTNTVCTACPAGKYKTLLDGSTCLNCTTVCSAGKQLTGACTLQATFDQTNCSECFPGSYKNVSDISLCIACPLGTANNVTGLTTVCPSCFVGQYQNATGQTACIACPLGTANNVPGLTSICPSCLVGQYQNTTGQTACVACPLGTANNVTGLSTVCPFCLEGQYQDAIGQLVCKFCSASNSTVLPSSCTQSSASSSTVAVLASGVAGGCGVFLAIIFVLVYLRRRKTTKNPGKNHNNATLPDTAGVSFSIDSSELSEGTPYVNKPWAADLYETSSLSPHALYATKRRNSFFEMKSETSSYYTTLSDIESANVNSPYYSVVVGELPDNVGMKDATLSVVPVTSSSVVSSLNIPGTVYETPVLFNSDYASSSSTTLANTSSNDASYYELPITKNVYTTSGHTVNTDSRISGHGKYYSTISDIPNDSHYSTIEEITNIGAMADERTRSTSVSLTGASQYLTFKSHDKGASVNLSVNSMSLVAGHKYGISNDKSNTLYYSDVVAGEKDVEPAYEVPVFLSKTSVRTAYENTAVGHSIMNDTKDGYGVDFRCFFLFIFFESTKVVP